MNVRVLVLVYLAAVVAANWSISHFGPASAAYNAFLLIGLDLVTRDRLHDAWKDNHLWVRMGLLIAAGSAASYWIFGSSGRVAAASCAAFAVAATCDAVVYHLARRLPWLERSNLSNVAGAAADSMVFQSLAFGWAFPFIFAQFVAKVAGGLLWSLILNRRRGKPC